MEVSSQLNIAGTQQVGLQEQPPAAAAPSIRIHASLLARYTGHNTFENVMFPQPADHFWSVNEQLGRARGLAYTPLPAQTDAGNRVHTVSNEAFQEAAAWVGLRPGASRAAVCTAVEARIEAAARNNRAVGNAPLSLRDAVSADVAKRSGTLNEAGDVRRFSQKTKLRVQRDRRNWTKELVGLHAEYRVILAGEIDGELADGCVVEMKHRTRKLAGRIWASERVQLHCYMFLRNVRRSYLVETWQDTSASHLEEFDDAFWTSCLSKLRAFLACEVGALQAADVCTGASLVNSVVELEEKQVRAYVSGGAVTPTRSTPFTPPQVKAAPVGSGRPLSPSEAVV